MSEQPAVRPVTRRCRFDVHVDRHLVVHVRGELDVSTAPQFAVELEKLAIDGGTICVDLASLEFCGAAGVNVLAGAVRTLGTRGRLVVYDPSPLVARILDITGLDHLIEVVVGRVVAAPLPDGATDDDPCTAHRTVGSPDLALAGFEAEDR